MNLQQVVEDSKRITRELDQAKRERLSQESRSVGVGSDQMEGELNELQAALMEANARNRELMEKNDALRKALKTAKDEKEGADDKTRKVASELNADAIKLQTSLKRSKEQCMKLEAKVHQSNQLCAQLEVEVNQTNQLCTELEAEVNEATNRCAELENEVNETRKKCDKVEKELKQSKEQCSKLENEVNLSYEQCTKMETEINTLKQEVELSQADREDWQKAAETAESDCVARGGRRSSPAKWFNTSADGCCS
jgi:chromosome segregation ATPase